MAFCRPLENYIKKQRTQTEKSSNHAAMCTAFRLVDHISYQIHFLLAAQPLKGYTCSCTRVYIWLMFFIHYRKLLNL
jgi:hypothetical protein